MAYNNSIPQPTDALKNSQADLLANFQAIKTLIDVNHGTFDSANQGKHLYVSFPVQGASPATLAGEVALFSRASSYTGVTELSYRRESNGAVTECTAADLTIGQGWSFMPSGLLLKWGYATVAGSGAQTILFPVGPTIPVFSAAVSAQITPFTAVTTQVVTLRGYYANRLEVQTSVAGMQVVYLALGIV